jgi:general secretion pathway protein G
MVLRVERGFTFIELLVVTTILIVLASAIMPLARVTLQREREAELHRALREIRLAIDKYKDAVDTGQIGSTDIRAGSEGYPPDLDTLVEGVSKANDASGIKLKFLRRVPMDPITHSTEWGMRSYQDKPDSSSWGGQNVYDVYSKAEGTGLDGTKYKEW